MDKYKDYSIDDFINDGHFVKWVLSPDELGDRIFNEFQKKYPEKRYEMSEAAYLIKALQPIESDITNDRLSQIWLNINKKQKSQGKNLFISILKYAAVFIFLIIIGGLYYIFNDSAKFRPSITGVKAYQKGHIILSDGTVKYFDSKKTTIKYLARGVSINGDTLKCKEERYNNSKSALNHVILPYGMRSEIILSDGTHVYLNSGSKFSYPNKFDRDSRGVYLSGEAFFDVKENPQRPFYVYTNDIKIKVLGTRFNVSTYSDDRTVQVVLLKGKVNIRKNNLLSKSLNILPGERAVFNRNDATLSKGRVDVALYSSWIHGYLIFKKAPLSEVAKKLERYYKRDITVSNDIRGMTFSGKLDLKDNIDDVIEYISFASSINIIKEKECIILKP